jgi:hypothetical protein
LTLLNFSLSKLACFYGKHNYVVTTTSYLLIKPSNDGYGVFANKNFSAGEVICEFYGQLYSREALPQPYDSVEDH